MISQNWESGLTCSGCGEEIPVGADMLYGRHLACARKPPEVAEDPLDAARAVLEAGGRVALAKKHLRALAALACEGLGQPAVRRPDRGKRGLRWYARCPGWSAERVDAGLSTLEVAGLWLDILETGRTPPVSHEHLRMLLDAAQTAQPVKG